MSFHVQCFHSAFHSTASVAFTSFISDVSSNFNHSIYKTSMAEQLEKRIEQLEEELRQERAKNEGCHSARSKIEAMSAEVVDSNPYSRLMALKRMGIVNNYEVSLLHFISLHPPFS